MLDHAVVMGGSVAGLCAAAALSEVAKSVTLLERDPDPKGALVRKGTPQAHHAHALLNLGARSLESLFPGVLDELVARGAVHGDAAEVSRWYIHGGWRPSFVKGLEIRVQTRPLLEACLREHLQARNNASVRFATSVDAPIFDEAAKLVRGVVLEGGERIDADLVVDATGRGSKSPKWLEQWGYGRVKEYSVELGLAYVSGLFTIPREALGVDVLMIYPRPPTDPHFPGQLVNKRGGVAFHVEGDRWMVTQFGYHGDHAPTDLAAFGHHPGELVSHHRRGARPDAVVIADLVEDIGELVAVVLGVQIGPADAAAVHVEHQLPGIRPRRGHIDHRQDTVCAADSLHTCESRFHETTWFGDVRSVRRLDGHRAGETDSGGSRPGGYAPHPVHLSVGQYRLCDHPGRRGRQLRRLCALRHSNARLDAPAAAVDLSPRHRLRAGP